MPQASIWLVIVLALLALIIFALLFWQRQRTRLTQSPDSDSIIEADAQGTVNGTARFAPRERWRSVSTRTRFWGGGLALALIAALAIFFLPSLFASRRADRFVVLVAPFRDTGGEVGQTGRVVAQSLADVLAQQTSASGNAIVVEQLSDAPVNADEAYRQATTRDADVVIWGEVSPGGVLDQESLLPSIAYAPNGAYTPNAWDGYTGRFAMPRVFTLASAPINGQAVLPQLITALANYADNNADLAFDAFARLANDYPALEPALPAAFEGNVLWARGAYSQAADAYRIALSNPAIVDGARLANNLGAILLDARSEQAINAFDQSLNLLKGGENDMGALRFNLGLLALEQGRAAEAADGLTAAKGLLPPNAALLLTLASAQREAGAFDAASTTLTAAEQQISDDTAEVPSALVAPLRDALRARLQEGRGTLALAQLAGGSGPLSWEMEAMPTQLPNNVKPARSTLENAVATAENVAAAWRSSETADAARSRPGASLIDTGQVERAQDTIGRLQLTLYIAQTEENRSNIGSSRGFLASIFGGLISDRTQLTTVQGVLALRVRDDPNDIPALVQYARVLRLRQQFDLANQSYDSLIAAAPTSPEGFGGKGLVAMDRGQRDNAKTLLSQALDRNQGYFPARIALAQMAESEQDWSGATTQLEWLANNRPRPEDTVMLGQVLRRSGNLSKAEETLLPLTQENTVTSVRVDALIELGRLYNDAEKTDNARDAYEKALNLDSHSSPAAFELGQTLIKQNDTAGAERRLRQAIDSDPTNVDARLTLAELYTGPLQNPAAADELYRNALQQGVTDPIKLSKMGDALMLHNVPGDASKAYLQALQQQPDNADLNHKLAQSYLAQNNLEGARISEQRALNLSGNALPAALVGMGDIERQSGRYDQAVSFYNQALTQDSTLAQAAIGLGQVAAAQGNWSVALGQFQQAATRDPNDAMAQFWLGEALLRQPNPAAAVEAYNRAIGLRATFPEAYLGLAQAQLAADPDRTHGLATALGTVNTAIRSKSRYAEAMLFKGKVQQEQGQNDQALRSYNDAINANSKLAEPYFRRGLLYVQQSNYNQASDDLQRAVSRQNNFPEAHYWLGRTYYAQGNLNSALSEFKTAVSLQGDSYAEARLYQGRVEEQLGNREAAALSFQAVIQADSGGQWAATAQQELAQRQ